MPIITISRGSYSKGKEVAERAAEKLGYKIISRDIMLGASEEFDVPEIRLVRAIHDAPSILDRLSHRKEKYIAYIQAALLQEFIEDNIVYHGLAGHFFVRNIPHVLKVRILSDMKDRVRTEMERERISGAKALRVLKKDDEERRKWSQYLYGIDTRDPSLYDLVIHIQNVTVDDAVDIVCHTAGLDRFQATAESEAILNNLTLSAVVKAAIVDIDHDARVTAKGGSVFIESSAILSQHYRAAHDIKDIVKNIPGTKSIHVVVKPVLPITG